MTDDRHAATADLVVVPFDSYHLTGLYGDRPDPARVASYGLT
ncbi:hypothetical protein ACIRBX_04455 [Kitasatospora sp. NPDC096147]